MSQQWGGQGGQPWGQQGQQPWGQQWSRPGAAGNPWGGGTQPGPPQWGAQQSPQQWGGQPGQSKKSGGLGKVLLIAGGLVVAAVLGLVIWNLTQPQYKNDNYQIPPATANAPELPINENPAEWDAVLTRNALYQQTVDSPVRCQMNPERLDPDGTPEQVQAYLQQEMNCLYRVWGPTLDRTGKYHTFVPTVTVYTDSITTACGTKPKEPNAFYCGADQQLYFSMDMFRHPATDTARVHPVADFIMAHEYAHLLQGRVEIAGVRYQSADQLTKSEWLTLGRRNELQADCLAGMYTAAVAQSRGYGQTEVAAITALTQQIGDDSGGRTAPGDHGTMASREYWSQLGMSTTEVAKCNTYAASPDLVR
ncbi:neutral zinc metallopeptidase [Granulicoccus phenolivorans]|uniref:neutral zinc metallopeptidase n=1 Tax=Granulicoccus phenolivorans TaxID=266854 RepID=UPI0004296171|nr:neutral zinc metallopeptidase [Granulicoccus phenolivorans]